MIPRPRSEGAAKRNAGRWICTRRAEKCDGKFRVYGQDMPCPLRAKCFWGRGNTYEWSLGAKRNEHYASLDVDVMGRKEHDRRLKELKYVMAPKRRASTPEERERRAAKAREKRRREREANPQAFATLPKRPLLPCGEDCEGGCPYDGDCPYTDKDIEALEKKQRQKMDRIYKERVKAKAAVDPVYRARLKELEAARQKRYREAHKEELRAKARERWRLKHNKTKG